VLREPLSIAAAWKGSELAQRDDWRETLTDADVAELERAIAAAKRTGKSMGDLTKDDFPLPTFSKKIDRWREEVQAGRGFQVLGGVPAERWPEGDTELFFWCFGQHFGIPGAQNPQADLLGHVRDYFRSAIGVDGQLRLSDADRALLDLYNEIADSPDFHLDMDLEPGDVQLLSNHTVLHARTDYEDHLEPELKRHLLRLWISLPARASLATQLRTQRSRIEMLATLVGSKLGHAIRRAAS
jgi:hypothetical protein